jgi:para-aminobenzoate synthetase component 1
VFSRELPWQEPAVLALKLHREPGFVWLDSAGSTGGKNRYSYIASNPVSRFRRQTAESSAEFDRGFRDWQSQFTTRMIADGAPFQGGAIGYVTYDAAEIWVSDFSSRHSGDAGDILEFAFYDTVLAFDHQQQSLTVYSAGLNGPDSLPDEALARQRISSLAEICTRENASRTRPAGEGAVWTRASPQAPYTDLVSAVREAILDGEIYQANIASLWTRPPQSYDEAFFTYLVNRNQTRAAFSAFGAFTSRTLASLSPERLVTMNSERDVRTEPIKGTARRSANPEQDQQIAKALAASEKDRAENIMIVDLLRNDLSRVCRPESVIVSGLCDVEQLPNLFHLVSSIEGKLKPSLDAIDLLGAVFPGGSVTGAPKLRAMEIIDELEPSARGAFCGSFGYIGHDGTCDFNIMIRTVDHVPGGDRYWSGAGITLLSDTHAEWEEVQLKAERIIDPPVSGMIEI